MNIAQVLFFAGALPLVLLGLVHLVFTLRDQKEPQYIVPRNADLIESMKAERLKLTKETDMWRAWLGFNVSHSIAVLGTGGAFLYISYQHFDILSGDPFLLWPGPVLAWVFTYLSKRFWFSRPFLGSLVSAVCFTAGAFLVTFMG